MRSFYELQQLITKSVGADLRHNIFTPATKKQEHDMVMNIQLDSFCSKSASFANGNTYNFQNSHTALMKRKATPNTVSTCWLEI